MAWVKIPKEHHALFLAALPSAPRPTTVPMFGGLFASVNGNMACGLFARSVMVRLAEPYRSEALALDGASLFDPMGRGAKDDSDRVMLPEDVMHERDELRMWIQRALAHTATLPNKAVSRRPAARASTSRSARSRTPRRRPA